MTERKTPHPTPATDAFDLALKVVNDERGSAYGHPFDNFWDLAMMQAPIQRCADPRLRQALYMIASKLSRLIENPEHLDSWIDVAGYARTAVMVIDRQSHLNDECAREFEDEDILAKARGEQ